MAQYNKTVARHPTDCAASLTAVLDAVIFFTADGDTLVDHEVKEDEVVLTFEGE